MKDWPCAGLSVGHTEAESMVPENLNPPTCCARLPSKTQEGVLSVKGKIHYRADRGYYYVSWYVGKKQYKVSRYKGFLCRAPEMAERLLHDMRSDHEDGTFRIAKYTQEKPEEVVTYLWNWLDLVSPGLSPGTIKDYRNSIKNHLGPFFRGKNIELHEISKSILMQLKSNIKREDKGKKNVMGCLHACLAFACEDEKISRIPPFPKIETVNRPRKYILEDEQDKIINAIPLEYQPIFWFLKYHGRRPSEARALQWPDVDRRRGLFVIKRAFSNEKLWITTKEKKWHIIPIVSDFEPWLNKLQENVSSVFVFVRPDGKYYHKSDLNRIWNRACEKVGSEIGLYPGTKHSLGHRMINEWGLSLEEVREAFDHASIESTQHYADYDILRRKQFLEGKVVRIDKNQVRTKEG